MKLVFKSNCLSIKKFNTIELPDLTILTGLNGTGKSQLLTAIRHGHVLVDDIPKENIVVFDNSLFGLDNEPAITFQILQSDRTNTFNSIKEFLPEHYITPIRAFLDTYIKISKLNSISFYLLTKEMFEKAGNGDIYPPYQNYLANVESMLLNNYGGSNPHINKPILQRITKEIQKPVEELTREEFDNLYSPISYKNNFLINNLARVFSDYWEKWEQNSYYKYRNKEYEENHLILSESEFVNKYGERPWRIINKIIERFGSLKYYINNPEGIERGHEYTIKLISNTDNLLNIEFNALSSGERIMMGLVATLYKTKIDKNFPGVLLLDEIDAALHPSMAQSLLEVIEEDLVAKKNLKVIFITHSASTVALAPEDSIYVMNKIGEDRIVKSSNKEALHILSEGFASLTISESNLQVSYNIQKYSEHILLTEGITDRMILETARKYLAPDLNFDIQDCFDAGFLRNLFSRGEIFKNYAGKTFIALFDFDFEGYTSWNNLSEFDIIESNPEKGLLKKHKSALAYALLLPVPNNDVKFQVIKSGYETYRDQSHMPIELLFYGIPLLKTSFINEPQVGHGNLIKFKGNKIAFAEKATKLLNVSDFQVLNPLFETLRSIFNK